MKRLSDGRTVKNRFTLEWISKMWYSKDVKRESQKHTAYPYNEFTAILYSRSLLGVVGGYILPLKIVYHSPTRDTMKIPIWIRSEYVTYIGKPSFLSSGGLAPPKKMGG